MPLPRFLNHGLALRHLLLLLFLLIVPAIAAKPKQVVMPFAKNYGVGSGSSWFSVPLTVGDTDFNLTISNTLQKTWIPGNSACDKAQNKTECLSLLGGQLPSPPSGDSVAMARGLRDLYGTSLQPARNSDHKSALALKGSGVIANEKITLGSNTGTFVLDQQSVGIFTTEGPDFNGYLSLPQISHALFNTGATPGSNFHLYLGLSAESNDSSPPDTSRYDAGKYVLIFGGYDKSVWDFNQTQQYRLGDGGKMEAELEDVIYRWTSDGATDNNVIASPHKVVIDTTTPYVWLPQATVDTLVKLSGAKWNDSMDSYTFTRCFTDCTTEEDNSRAAVLDLVFNTGQKLTIDFSTVFRLQSLLYDPYWTENRPVMPVRALQNDGDPIVLGRAMMAACHLWVDYDDAVWGIKAANTSNYYNPNPDIVPWGKDHPPITNTTILAPPLTSSSYNPSTSSGSNSTPGNNGSGNNGPPGPPIGIIAGAAGGFAAILVVAAFLFIRRRRRKRTQMIPAVMPLSNDPSMMMGNSATSPGPSTKPGVSELPPGDYYKLQELDSKVYPAPPHNLAPVKTGISELPPAAGQNNTMYQQHPSYNPASPGTPAPRYEVPGYGVPVAMHEAPGNQVAYGAPNGGGPQHPPYAHGGGNPQYGHGEQSYMVHEMPAEPWGGAR